MEIAELTELKLSKVPLQTMIINGQEQVIMGDAYTLVCPRCGQVLQQFQPGVSELDILHALSTDKEEELKATLHCTKCGQALHIMRPTFIDVEVEEKQEHETIEENHD